MDSYRVRIIINPVAGGLDRGEELSESVKKVFAGTRGFFEIKRSMPGRSIATLAEEAAKKKYFAVIVAGGDSTVREAASSLMDSDTALGIVPTGRVNHIAKGLAIPDKIGQALHLIHGATSKELDIGAIAGKTFFISAGLGFDWFFAQNYPIISENPDNSKERLLFPYISKELREFKRYSSVPVVIREEGETTHVLPFIVRFALREFYGKNTLIGPGKKGEDGSLDLYSIPHIDSKSGPKAIQKALRGDLAEIPGFRHQSGPGPYKVGAGSKVAIHADGERFEADGGFEVSLNPGGLRVWTGG